MPSARQRRFSRRYQISSLGWVFRRHIRLRSQLGVSFRTTTWWFACSDQSWCLQSLAPSTWNIFQPNWIRDAPVLSPAASSTPSDVANQLLNPPLGKLASSPKPTRSAERKSETEKRHPRQRSTSQRSLRKGAAPGRPARARQSAQIHLLFADAAKSYLKTKQSESCYSRHLCFDKSALSCRYGFSDYSSWLLLAY